MGTNKLCFIGIPICLFVIVLTMESTASPIPDPNPGHMIIPYYIKQKEMQEKKELDRLRRRCESFIESGYYSDPQCEKLYLNSYNGFNSASKLKLTVPFFTSLLLILTLFLL